MREVDHKEFPKMLYEGGVALLETGRPVPASKTRVVADAAEEADARAEGFSEAGASEGGEDTASGGGDDTLAAGAGSDTISGADGSEPLAGSATDSDPAHVLEVAGEPVENAFDHDGDGKPGGGPKGGLKPKK